MIAFHNSKYEVSGRENGLWKLTSLKTRDDIFVRACKYIGRMGMTLVLDESGTINPTYATSKQYPEDSREYVTELMNSVSSESTNQP